MSNFRSVLRCLSELKYTSRQLQMRCKMYVATVPCMLSGWRYLLEAIDIRNLVLEKPLTAFASVTCSSRVWHEVH
jgi:hypothetical protein